MIQATTTLTCAGTVEALANYRTSGYKIELLYFFATGWLDRSWSSRKDKSGVDLWWGDSSWKQLPTKSFWRAQVLCERMRNELGYEYAYPFPIFESGDGGRVMYYMIHATDHHRAPKIMYSAYSTARDFEYEDIQQTELALGEWISES